MPSPRPLRIVLAVATIALLTLLVDAGRAEAAVVPGRPTVAAVAERAGLDIDGRWFALFAGAFVLLPRRRRAQAAAPAPPAGDAAGSTVGDPGDTEASDDGRRPPALPAASLDDLDPELMTAVLQVWAER